MLALTILLIGAVSLFLQFKIGLYTILDTYLLDRFEERLLTRWSLRVTVDGGAEVAEDGPSGSSWPGPPPAGG